jgi:hypothetical protein
MGEERSRPVSFSMSVLQGAAHRPWISIDGVI